MIKGNGMDINTSPNTEAVIEAKKAIIEILNAKADQTTIQMALKCLEKSITPAVSYVTNCVVNGADQYGISTEATRVDSEDEE